MENRPPVRLGMRVSAETNDWLDKKAAEMMVSKSALLAFAVENYRKEVETVKVFPDLMEQLKHLGVDTGK